MVFPGIVMLLAAALPVVEESASRLDRVWIAGPSWERYTLVTVPVPVKPPQHTHFRLRVTPAASAVCLQPCIRWDIGCKSRQHESDQ